MKVVLCERDRFGMLTIMIKAESGDFFNSVVFEHRIKNVEALMRILMDVRAGKVPYAANEQVYVRTIQHGVYMILIGETMGTVLGEAVDEMIEQLADLA